MLSFSLSFTDQKYVRGAERKREGREEAKLFGFVKSG